jgi:hypothetical protein
VPAPPIYARGYRRGQRRCRQLTKFATRYAFAKATTPPINRLENAAAGKLNARNGCKLKMKALTWFNSTKEIYMPPRKKARSSTASRSQRTTEPFCRNPPRPIPQLSPAVIADALRAGAIISTRSKWVNGTVLHYCLFGGGSYPGRSGKTSIFYS